MCEAIKGPTFSLAEADAEKCLVPSISLFQNGHYELTTGTWLDHQTTSHDDSSWLLTSGPVPWGLELGT